MTREPFEYAVLRALPCLERGEFVNVGVLVYSRSQEFLASRVAVDDERLRALCATVDCDAVRAAVAAVERVCAGDAEAGAAGEGPPGQRFRWLTAPRSTLVQPGPVHAGLTGSPAVELDRLFARLVALG